MYAILVSGYLQCFISLRNSNSKKSSLWLSIFCFPTWESFLNSRFLTLTFSRIPLLFKRLKIVVVETPRILAIFTTRSPDAYNSSKRCSSTFTTLTILASLHYIVISIIRNNFQFRSSWSFSIKTHTFFKLTTFRKACYLF